MTREAPAFFWSTHAGAELDLMLWHGGRRFGFEFKFAEAPAPARSMHIARADLELTHLWVIHPGRHSFPLAPGLTALPLEEVAGLPGLMSAAAGGA